MMQKTKQMQKKSPFMIRLYEVVLGSINGLTIVLFLIAYSLILSI